ncbi:prealbumin-like fold domain-containing protein [Cellulomonas dongxiuzhuiae]|uniref:prealbumin-like fold domain-containing protein n=1 Tax=Cellulomonas dongxiuzhuiae TaxID=2819979 RepID=UPI003FD71EEE
MALAARDFQVTGESVTLTEHAPAASWELSSITCRDGLNAAIPSGLEINLASRSVTLANVPEATSAPAAPITCTFLSTYVAPTTLTLVSTTIPSGTTAVPTAGWSFTADGLGGPLVTAGAAGSAVGTIDVPSPTRSVRVTETVQAGYVLDRVSCRRSDQSVVPVAVTANHFDLTLERGRSYTCTVLNLRPGVSLVKQAFLASDTGFTTPLAAAQPRDAGTALVWRYTVRNTGQTTLSGILLRDATTVTTNGAGTTNGFASISCPGRPDIAAGTTVTIPTLAPGQEIRCQASGVL